jgi:hygromycin-B 7''-O-kinase
MPADLADLTPTAANLLLRDVLPGHRVVSCVQRTGGQLSRVYEASFSEDTDPLIVKIYAEAWRWKQAKETHVYQMLEQNRVGPVPRILHTAVAPEQLGGHSYTVMTLLPGQPLSAVSARLAESDLFSVYRQMGSSLAALHRIGQPAFGYLTTAILDPKPTNTDYMTCQFAKKLSEFSGLAATQHCERPSSGTSRSAQSCSRRATTRCCAITTSTKATSWLTTTKAAAGR